MERIQSNSSRIRVMTYEGDTLTIEFQRGGTYKYSHVPEDVKDSLFRAESHGKAFERLIKGNYEFEKV